VASESNESRSTDEVNVIRQAISRLLSDQAVKRHHQYPTRANTIHSLAVVLLALPLGALFFIVLLIRRAMSPPLRIEVLATEGEFGPMVELFEYLRSNREIRSIDCIFVLSPRRHLGFSQLYGREFGVPIIWSTPGWDLLQQAIMLQPRVVIDVRRLTYRIPHHLPENPVVPSTDFEERRASILASFNLRELQFVALAVHTREYDEKMNPHYARKEYALESIGSGLTDSIDSLTEQDIDVVILGSIDTGKSRIDRELLRLSQRVELGGFEEVAVASVCKYFWSDNVGAWHLSAPFSRPVLFSNEARLRQRRGVIPREHLFVPARYVTQSGHELSFRDLLMATSSPYKAVSRGELRMIRNSPEEINNAHREMIARCDGTWEPDETASEVEERFRRLLSQFPELHQVRVASDFLVRHAHLID